MLAWLPLPVQYFLCCDTLSSRLEKYRNCALSRLPVRSRRSFICSQFLHGLDVFLLNDLGVGRGPWFQRALERLWNGIETIGERVTVCLVSNISLQPLKKSTYMSTSMSCPEVVFAGLISKLHRIRAMLIATELDPTCSPGQTRRPQPKALWPKVPG